MIGTVLKLIIGTSRKSKKVIIAYNLFLLYCRPIWIQVKIFHSTVSHLTIKDANGIGWLCK